MRVRAAAIMLAAAAPWALAACGDDEPTHIDGCPSSSSGVGPAEGEEPAGGSDSSDPPSVPDSTRVDSFVVCGDSG